MFHLVAAPGLVRLPLHMVVKSSGGLGSPLADFGGLGGPAGGLADWRTLAGGLWRTGGLLADFWRTSGGQGQFPCHSTRGVTTVRVSQSVQFSFLATPREGQNSV
eukprot:gene13528-biopygen2295